MIDQLAKRYGQIFHEIRVRRCLTIDQVRGGLDASTVSRFERGLAMIFTANLIALLHSAGMSGTEFFNIVGALQPTVIERLMDDIQLAIGGRIGQLCKRLCRCLRKIQRGAFRLKSWLWWSMGQSRGSLCRRISLQPLTRIGLQII